MRTGEVSVFAAEAQQTQKFSPCWLAVILELAAATAAKCRQDSGDGDGSGRGNAQAY